MQASEKDGDGEHLIYEVDDGAAELRKAGRPAVIQFTFAEKAIMLCKAAAMEDHSSFDSLLRCDRPRKARVLGRDVQPFDEKLWDVLVCPVAAGVTMAKFKLPELTELPFASGSKLYSKDSRLAEWERTTSRLAGEDVITFATRVTEAFVKRVGNPEINTVTVWDTPIYTFTRLQPPI